ncbi:hypothetical protein MesoLjLc_51600 [Mesorhizobium sp. L-8-10]|nr:hypothetical protein MesoLjLc_51600 [Mesorhizobium sp. L-8-10]
MARQKGSSTKAKLTVVGGTTPATGHNLTEDQQQALFFQNKSKIVALKQKLASVSGELRSAYKTAKSDGFTKKEIDFAIALEGDDDNKIGEERKRQNMIAAWLGHPIGTQAELDLQPDRRPIEERAAAEGKKAGMEGQALKPPYAPGAPGYDAYVEAWHKGQAAIFAIKKKPEDAPELLREQGKETAGKPDDFDQAADSSAATSAEKGWPDDDQIAKRQQEPSQEA